jgi:divinyl protochlorophyllide a 8-vinyl-reductase
MAAPTQGPTLHRPRKGFLGPQSVTQLVAATEKLCGSEAAEALCREAQLHRLPDWDEPVREEKVARLHVALWKLFPESAEDVCRRAGRQTTDFILDERMPARALRLLSLTRRSIAVWLLTRAARQHSWAFHGSGTFKVNRPLEYEVLNNPLAKGRTSDCPVCHYHAAAFERLFQRLIDPAMRCREVACIATGAPSCRFVLEMATPQAALH